MGGDWWPLRRSPLGASLLGLVLEGPATSKDDQDSDHIDINVYSDDEAIANTHLTPQAAAELWERIEAVDARIAAMSPEELEEREAGERPEEEHWRKWRIAGRRRTRAVVRFP